MLNQEGGAGGDGCFELYRSQSPWFECNSSLVLPDLVERITLSAFQKKEEANSVPSTSSCSPPLPPPLPFRICDFIPCSKSLVTRFMVAFLIPILPTLARRPPRHHPTCNASQASAESAAMLQCVELAKRALGQTRPNPPVGCILLSPAGETLGKGFHACAGSAHAEVAALADAADRGNDVHGATAYVTLEPCDHYGRTPPCSKTLSHAGVRKVCIGMVDPNPKVAGGGVRRLRRAGVEVKVGVQEGVCRELVAGFVRRVEKKRPVGVLKYAMTLDGKIATEEGKSKWVTGEAARRRVHEIRRSMDAIVIGGQTMRMDDPRLTVRDVSNGGVLQPIRVVVSKSMRLPTEARMWESARKIDTVVLTGTDHGQHQLVSLLKDKGVVVEQVPGLRPDDVMAYLYSRDCLNVLWECGGGLAASAIKDGAVQKVHAFVAPKLIGGQHAPTPVASPPLGANMTDALALHNPTIETFENGDILVTGYLE